ncbi:MAG: GGDEF domain-containing protein, partial [Eubacterium sp.]|nr:GGDEF domain-containing protein [Eubacterium sp.]
MGVSHKQYVAYLTEVILLTHSEEYDREAYLVWVKSVCRDYRIAKAVTEFYPTPMMRRNGQGEIFCDVDNGKGVKILLRIELMTKTKSTIIGTLYTEEEDEERTEEEKKQLDIFLRLIIGFVARRRLIRTLQEFGFEDETGFPNYRALSRYLDIANVENTLGGKVAFHMDLHNFTMVNQEIGRKNGDIVMRTFFNMVKDVIGDTGILIRLGGDKFVGIFDRKVKRQVFELLSGTLVPYDKAEDKKILVQAAVGVYMLPNPFTMNVYGDIMDKIMMASM